ncbi:MAG: hypothetical protein HN348_25600 [Proteobacteria bacterium]|jgi:hypothetical protein|nr:hypothetical protein [Pseudomonadota bacterium]
MTVVRPEITKKALWPGIGSQSAVQRHRLDQALGVMPEDVSSMLSEWLDNGQPFSATVLIQGLAMAGLSGAHPVEALENKTVRLERADGSSFVMRAIAFSTPSHPRGKKEDVARLVEALSGVFGERRFLLYLRRAVPEGFEPAALGRAVQLWLMSIERGEWVGRHAVYEDDEVSLEITLLERKSGSMLIVGPTTALEQLSTVDSHVVEIATQHRLAHPDLPMVLVVAADNGWGLPRGFVEQLLYGTADVIEVNNDSGEMSYKAKFMASSLSLFSDPECRNLGGIWWLEPHRQENLAFRAWATENPWCVCGTDLPAFPGTRFTQVGKEKSGLVEMIWSGRLPTCWGA